MDIRMPRPKTKNDTQWNKEGAIREVIATIQYASQGHMGVVDEGYY
jgi:hypothetical protein